MTIHTLKYSTELSDESPIVFALPGLVGAGEQTRMNNILEDLAKIGTTGILIYYAQTTRETEKTIKCRFNFDQVTEEITRTIEKELSSLKANRNRIGLISNSISAIPATKILANSNSGFNISVYSSISPLLGWKYFARPELRKLFEEGADIPISSPEEKKAGIIRLIPRDLVSHLAGINLFEELDHLEYKSNGAKVLTVMGKRDNSSSPDSIREYHKRIGGSPENLIELDAGHDVMGSDHYIIDFMARNLSK